MTNLERLQKSPIDFLYIFITDKYLKLIKQYIGKQAYSTIKSKSANQIRLLSTWAVDDKSSYEVYRDKVATLIQQQYGMTPGAILLDLLSGKPVAGKDWKNGVYGIGATPLTTFTQNTDLKVNPSTGALTFKGQELDYSYPTIQDRQTVGFTYSLGGNTYTTKYNTATGQWYANTYGSADTMQFADGSTYTASKGSSVWETISTAMPLIQKLLNWILSLFGSGKTLISSENTLPSQEEFMTDDTQPNIAGFSIVGAILLGSVLLGTMKHNKRK